MYIISLAVDENGRAQVTGQEGDALPVWAAWMITGNAGEKSAVIGVTVTIAPAMENYGNGPVKRK